MKQDKFYEPKFTVGLYNPDPADDDIFFDSTELLNWELIEGTNILRLHFKDGRCKVFSGVPFAIHIEK